MNLSISSNLAGYANPIEMPVSELLTGSYVFSIPSYQRGYRWESSEIDAHGNCIKDNEVKQVDDLLNDLTSFLVAKKDGNYYLQPLMVKPKVDDSGNVEWDVLDGQQRLTTMLLVLKCLNEKLQIASKYPLYTIKYENRNQLDFGRITFDPQSADYDYPKPSDDLDSYFVRKAKDRIEHWFNTEVNGKQYLQSRFQEMLFFEDESRGAGIPPQGLRAIFIWYNVEPKDANSALTGDRKHDIEVFNRLNRGKIGLTDSELIKALFLLCLKGVPANSSLMTSETLVRKWDDMGKKLQNDEFWKMISPKNKEYSNRMDMLFDFISACLGNKNNGSSYRFYYEKMHGLLTEQDKAKVGKDTENLWNEIKAFFDILCKWHNDVHKHNFIGFLVDCGMNVSDIYRDLNAGKTLKSLLKEEVGLQDETEIDNLDYSKDLKIIRKTLLMFNVLTCDKYGQKFPYDLYRANMFDVEHVNSQTDNPIEVIDDKIEWINEQAFPCLKVDCDDKDAAGQPTASAIEASGLIKDGEAVLADFQKNGWKDVGNIFKPYRTRVENFYAYGSSSAAIGEKNNIGNLTLLNSSINREYKNALFPKKLRTLKRSDQEGAYIPLCTKYMFLKYYSNTQKNASAFSMMRWRNADQEDYVNAIKESIKSIM